MLADELMDREEAFCITKLAKENKCVKGSNLKTSPEVSQE